MNRCTRVQQCNREEEMWATALCPSSWLSRPWLLKHGIILMLSMENELANNWFTVTPSPLPCCASGSLWCSLICASCVWRGLTLTQATLRQHVTADFWYGPFSVCHTSSGWIICERHRVIPMCCSVWLSYTKWMSPGVASILLRHSRLSNVLLCRSWTTSLNLVFILPVVTLALAKCKTSEKQKRQKMSVNPLLLWWLCCCCSPVH